jgi:hypothetical protein
MSLDILNNRPKDETPKTPKNCTECSQLELYKVLDCCTCPIREIAEKEGIKERMDMEN